MNENKISKHYYVVTNNSETIIVSRDSESLINNEVILNKADNEDKQLIDVSSLDVPGMASMMTHQLGIPVSEHFVKSIISQNVTKKTNLSGKTMVLDQNEDSMTTMTPVDFNCSTSIRNAATVTNNCSTSITNMAPDDHSNNCPTSGDIQCGFQDSEDDSDNIVHMDCDNYDDANCTVQQLTTDELLLLTNDIARTATTTQPPTEPVGDSLTMLAPPVQRVSASIYIYIVGVCF